MPTYQYACTECGERLEVVQKFTDDPLTVCDACGGKLRKVFSAVGIVFKGSGFYRNDSRNGAEADGKGKHGDKEAAKDSKPAGSGDGASGSKSGSSDSSGSSGSAGSAGSSGDKAAAGSKNGSAGSSPGSSSGSSSSGAKVA